MLTTLQDKELDENLQDFLIENDSGARKPGKLGNTIIIGVALLWSLFQLWFASPFAYHDFFTTTLNIPVLNSSSARLFHLAFAVFLVFLAYPAFRFSSRYRIPVVDRVCACVAACCVLYLYIFRDELAYRIGAPTTFDIIIAVTGIVLLLEAARRALGPPLVIIALVFLCYSFAGHMFFIPEVLAHKGHSLGKIVSHQWLTAEGVFGIAIGVSTDFVFLFVLFGALLDKAGAGNYFIKVAFAMLGHFRGGPAKAAIFSSAMTGLISGSSIANVVTTGTFTVPLMRKVGFSREKAGAVEVASSVNGQLMPPVMGAAAFLMVEYVGISYAEVVKHAFIPAVISYIALLYIVHLEALKTHIAPLPKPGHRSFFYSFLSFGLTLCSLVIVIGAVYFAVQWIKALFPEMSFGILVLLIVATYVLLVFYASRFPSLQFEEQESDEIVLPELANTVKSGLHYLLPVVILVWCLMVEKMSPGLSAFWATLFMIFIVFTQKLLFSFFRRDHALFSSVKSGIYDVFDGLVSGARNMIGIAVATAAAGIIVGSVSLTGIGQVMTELVEVISGGSFLLALVFTALICLILGMGLPTTANYIVVANLMAGVIEALGRQNGLIIPLVAIHLFVFYFGIMADVTPPVGLASFAAAAVSGGEPIRTGMQAFVYSIRTVILPFVFIYNTELLLIGVHNWLEGIWIFFKYTVAILIFTAAMQGYFLVKNRMVETVLLFMVAFAIFRPGFIIDRITSPYIEKDASQIFDVLENMQAGEKLKIHFLAQDYYGDSKRFVILMPVSSSETAEEKLHDYGLFLTFKRHKLVVEDIAFASAAERAGIQYEAVITSIAVPQKQLDVHFVQFAAMILFALVVVLQRARRSEILSL